MTNFCNSCNSFLKDISAFEQRISKAAIAQWLERLSSKQEVMSSILIGGYTLHFSSRLYNFRKTLKDFVVISK